jgi:gamma-glutamyltranspeptidase / glutathione hydrolase
VRQVLSAAIDLARGGVPVTARLANTLQDIEGLFRTAWPTSASVWLTAGVPEMGGTLYNPTLAATYDRIARESESATADRVGQIDYARGLFYRGFVAAAIDAFVARTEVTEVPGQPRFGFLAAGDLSAWSATYEDPVTLNYEGVTVCKPGPWSQGPVFLQQLAMLEHLDFAERGLGSAHYVHTVAEVAKLAFADREAWYGDPRYADVPLDVLLSSEYARERVGLIERRASLDLRPGSPGGRRPQLADLSTVGSGLGTGEPTRGTGEPTRMRQPNGDTCHLDVADRYGNLVSATPSGGWLQSSPAIPELGFCLGTRAQMFWLADGHPNALAPGKRPRTTLSPTLVLRDAEPWLAFGTPGGDQQDQWSLTFFLAHMHSDLDLQAAIDAPTFHTDHFPSSFYPRQASPGHLAVEGRIGVRTINALVGRGHRVVREGDWSLGWVCAVAREPDGTLRSAASPRGVTAYAAGR